MRMVVVLPAPFGPKKPNISPSSIVKLTLSTATRSLYFLTSSLATITAAINHHPYGSCGERSYSFRCRVCNCTGSEPVFNVKVQLRYN
ncbi:hypothetical protein Mpsy_1948 [Methanolobus psychrophilus R15]|nr:hypothetical protein Mpsy_1948 [Methanolobus psychrophilus R15]